MCGVFFSTPGRSYYPRQYSRQQTVSFGLCAGATALLNYKGNLSMKISNEIGKYIEHYKVWWRNIL